MTSRNRLTAREYATLREAARLLGVPLAQLLDLSKEQPFQQGHDSCQHPTNGSILSDTGHTRGHISGDGGIGMIGTYPNDLMSPLENYTQESWQEDAELPSEDPTLWLPNCYDAVAYTVTHCSRPTQTARITSMQGTSPDAARWSFVSSASGSGTSIMPMCDFGNVEQALSPHDKEPPFLLSDQGLASETYQQQHFPSPTRTPVNQPMALESPISPQPSSNESSSNHKQPRKRRCTVEQRVGLHVSPESPLPGPTCMRCKFDHHKCVSIAAGVPCERCLGFKYNMVQLPCVQLQIVDLALYRTGADPIFSSSACLSIDSPLSLLELGDRSPMGLQSVVYITQGLGSVLQLRTKQVISKEDASSPVERLHRLTLADVDGARCAVQEYIDDNMVQYVRQRVGQSDELTASVFGAAANYARRNESDPLLGNMLQLWTAARFIEGDWCFVNAQSSPSFTCSSQNAELKSAGDLDCQFTSIVINDILAPLRDKVLRQLNEMIYTDKRKNWFKVFLAMYILLHSFSLLMRQQRRFAQRRNSQLRYTNMPLIRSIHASAKTLLAHFHLISKGHLPFTIDWTNAKKVAQVSKIAELDDPEQAFLKKISPLIQSKVDDFNALYNTDDYGNPHWFTGQLFLRAWKPPDTHEHSPRVR